MNYIDKKQVVQEFKELLPWDKVDAFDEILDDMGENSIEDYLFQQGGYSPFDFINAEKCVEHYGVSTLLDEMDHFDIEEYMDAHPSTMSAYYLIEMLKTKWDWFGSTGISDTNIEELTNLLKKIKKDKKEKK